MKSAVKNCEPDSHNTKKTTNYCTYFYKKLEIIVYRQENNKGVSKKEVLSMVGETSVVSGVGDNVFHDWLLGHRGVSGQVRVLPPFAVGGGDVGVVVVVVSVLVGCGGGAGVGGDWCSSKRCTGLVTEFKQ